MYPPSSSLRCFSAGCVRPDPGARQRTLDAMTQFRKADEELKRICKEKGIPVPELIC